MSFIGFLDTLVLLRRLGEFLSSPFPISRIIFPTISSQSRRATIAIPQVRSTNTICAINKETVKAEAFLHSPRAAAAAAAAKRALKRQGCSARRNNVVGRPYLSLSVFLAPPPFSIALLSPRTVILCLLNIRRCK